MAVNVMDTAVHYKSSIAGGYELASMFSDEDLDVKEKSDLYNWFYHKVLS
jgi:hypothetical protein